VSVINKIKHIFKSPF